MPTDADFLRAVIADPDADAPRLAYADWRDECGDAARAEFIRVQCALAALPEEERRYHSLRDREAVLLKSHGETWFQTIERLWRPAIAAGWRGHIQRLFTDAGPSETQYRFRRGFVECLALPLDPYLRHAAEIDELTPLRELDVACVVDAIELLPMLAECPQLVRLTSLGVRSDELPTDELSRLIDSPHLGGVRELTLHGEFTNEAVSLLAASALAGRLEGLHLSKSAESSAVDVGPLFRATVCPNIKSLTLRQVGLDGDRLRSLAPLSNFASLSRLNLSGNSIGDEHAGYVIGEMPPVLDELDLSFVLCGDHGAAAFAASPNLRRLRALNLAGNAITDIGAMMLADSPFLLASTRLDLTGNRISRRVQNALRIRLGHHVVV